jgi:hypothetical protein
MSQAKPEGLRARELERFFLAANVRAEELKNCKGNQSKAVKIGMFLTPLVGREVPIEVKGRTGTAVLRVANGRSNEKRYLVEVKWHDEAAKGPRQAKQAAQAQDGETPPPSEQARKTDTQPAEPTPAKPKPAKPKPKPAKKSARKTAASPRPLKTRPKKGAAKAAEKAGRKAARKPATAGKPDPEKPAAAQRASQEAERKPAKKQPPAGRKGAGNDLDWQPESSESGECG